MKKLTIILACLGCIGILSACGQKNNGKDITIVYTNDVHSYIDNNVNEDGSSISGEGLRFSNVAAMVKDMEAEGKDVILVDAGDTIQGDIYGAMDEGENIIGIMNAAGYDVAAPGNHDFDYGLYRFFELSEKADFDYISCNFRVTESGETALPATRMFEFDGVKVAFIGITTPDTFTSSTPVYFQNEKGEFIYTFDGADRVSDLYDSVQSAIDSVRKEADFVIAIGHVGTGLDEKKKGIASENIIANTTGLDAFIDGHSHNVIEGQPVKDKKGKTVILTQTGNYLDAVGVMTLSAKGGVSAAIVTEYNRADEAVAELEKKCIEEVEGKMDEQVAVLDNDLYIGNPDEPSKRYIRSTELNLGDMMADSIYWFFNERLFLDCDVVIQNAGGIRSSIAKGNITYADIKKVEPFGNMVCLISATGREIVDALEMGVVNIGTWDEEWNIPAESGGFLQVAGIRYTVDASVESSVVTDGSGMYKEINGDYRVKDVQVYNRLSGEYEPIDPDKEYQVGGINYLLRNGGDGLGMFSDNEMTIDYVGQDYVIMAEYMKNFKVIGDLPEVCTANSPLNIYSGYLMDYDNPWGSGRITIENVEY